MIQLKIGNSESSIIGLAASQEKTLKSLLSYPIDSSTLHYRGNRGPKNITLLGKNGSFPTGLLYIVQRFLTIIPHELSDNRIQPPSIPDLFNLNLPYIPYPEQLEAAIRAKKYHRGIICAPTGVGKSAIVALIIKEIKVPTLVVVPTLNLRTQLIASLREAFGDSMVGGLLDRLPVAVENVDALDSKQILEGYDCVIIDEFHHSGAKTYRALNKKAWSGVYYRFGMTATPFRSKDNEKLLLESILSQVIYKITYELSVEKGYIVPMEAYYYTLPKTHTDAETWPGVYRALVAINQYRNQLICQIMGNLLDTSALCLVKEIAHGNILSEISGFPFMNGEDPNARIKLIEFLLNQKPVLIGTSGVIGEGVDTKPAEFIIIAGLGKSKNQFMQQVGRGFRTYKGKTSCKIILFKDPSHRWTLAHFKEQVKILKEEYNITPIQLELPILS